MSDIKIDDIYSGMVLFKDPQSVKDFDMIICNNKLETLPLINGKPQFTATKCNNYRAINYNNHKLYLRVGTIDLDSVNPVDSNQVNYYKYLDKFCQKIPEIKSHNGKIFYFKGAYTRFPSSWQKKSAEDFTKEPLSEQLKIYVKATQAILVNILPILKKMGFSVILVDPEPGYHPKTIGKSDDEKLNCLIKVYEDFGLKRVMCQIPKAIVEVYGEDVNIQDARKSIYGKHVPLAYDRTIMIGDIDEMLGNINGLIFNFFNMIGIEKTVAINNSKQVPLKFIADFDFPDYLTAEKFETIKLDSTKDIVKKKYLKYKNKYLALKNQTAGASGGVSASRIGNILINRFNPEEPIIGEITGETSDSYIVELDNFTGFKNFKKSDEGVTYFIRGPPTGIIPPESIRGVVDETIPSLTETNPAALKMLESITCPICLTRQKKVLICGNGHQLCAHCTIDFIFKRQHKNCPECRAIINIDQLKVLHQKYLFRTTF